MTSYSRKLYANFQDSRSNISSYIFGVKTGRLSGQLVGHKNAPPMVTASELSILSSVLQVLRHIEPVTKEVSGDKYCPSSKLIIVLF